MQLLVDRIKSDMFHFHKEDKRLTQEISSLEGFRFRPLYDDACDIGFELENAKTGNITRWYVEKVDIHHEEICGWYCKPADSSIRYNSGSGIENFTILIIND
jgi:hypothetical protein